MFKSYKLTIYAAVLAALLPVACSTPKDVAYMQDLEQTQTQIQMTRNAIKVQPEDKLSIVVKSKDPMLSELFNLPTVSHRLGSTAKESSLTSSNNAVGLYTVNPEGNIDFPVLGEIHIAGMTRSEVAKYIKDRLISDRLVNDPIVTVEFASTGIIVAGEVVRPGRYDINRDHITILEGLGLAGDLTIQGQRKNVLVIRDIDGKPTAYRVDLTNAQELMQSPVYYLQQNDYVYVEPNNMKKRSATVNGNTALSASFWVSVASLLTSIAVLIFK